MFIKVLFGEFFGRIINQIYTVANDISILEDLLILIDGIIS